MLNDIECSDQPDTKLLDSKRLSIPDTPRANVEPGQTDFRLVPISRMVRVHSLPTSRRATRCKRVPLRWRANSFWRRYRRRAVDFSNDGGHTCTRHNSAGTKASTVFANGRSPSRHRLRVPRSDGKVHQHQWRGTTRQAQLESKWVHAQRGERRTSSSLEGGENMVRHTLPWP